MNLQEFHAALDPEKLLPEVLEMLKKLVAFDTVRRPAEPGMPFGKKSAEALNWLVDKAKEDGFTAVNLDNYCGYIEYGDGPEMFAVACHLDTVPTGDPAEWTTPPLEMTLRDGAVYGRGCSDDKGPIAAVYTLMRELKAQNVKLKRRMRLIVGCGEETGSSCLDYYREHAEIPKYGITADAGYPVICGECGIIHFTLERVFRDGENKLKLTAGTVVNAVPGKAEAEYEGKKFSAVGRAAHASRPYLGENALVKLCKELAGKVDSDFPELVLKANPADLKLDFEDEYSKLTLVPSLAEVNEKHAMLKCDIRFPVTLKDPNAAHLDDEAEKGGNDPVKMKIQDVIYPLARGFAGTKYLLSLDQADNPLFFPPDTPFINELLKAYIEVTGDKEAKPLVIGGGTYAKHLPNTVAFGGTFPGIPSTAHEVNERWRIEDIKLNLKVLSRAFAVLDELD